MSVLPQGGFDIHKDIPSFILGGFDLGTDAEHRVRPVLWKSVGTSLVFFIQYPKAEMIRLLLNKFT